MGNKQFVIYEQSSPKYINSPKAVVLYTRECLFLFKIDNDTNVETVFLSEQMKPF